MYKPKFINKKIISKRLLKYTEINTTGNPDVADLPSTEGQEILASLVLEQLKDIGCIDISIDENGLGYATLKGNCETAPTIALFAHLDTAIDVIGDTNAQIITDYQGGNIKFLNEDRMLNVANNPQLDTFIGDDIIMTDGTSVLGADDKAAIAAIVESIRYIKNNDVTHGDLKIVLLPDEETGIRGAKVLDAKALGAKFGICLDCCGIGEYVVENFNAANATLTIDGVTAHPMSAKGVMINSQIIGMKFFSMLTHSDRPEHTEGHEGYIWLKSIDGETGKTVMKFDIRDHDIDKFEARKDELRNALRLINVEHDNCATLTINDDYFNVKNGLDKDPSIIELVESTFDELGIEKKPLIMRGGYDGSVITPNGLTTVNIFTGAYNFHSIEEFIPASSLAAAGDALITIIKKSAEN
ncbi:peptidase T [Vibrio mediterranei]